MSPDDFMAKASRALASSKLLLDAGDTEGACSPGMAVTVEIKTGTRRVIEYFLSPFLQYRDESLRER